MNKHYLTIVLLLLFYSCNQSKSIKIASNNLPESSNSTTKKQSDLIFKNSKVFPNKTQFSIALIKNGKVNFVGIKRSNDTISETENHQSVFEIGSLTKVFTATILSNLVLEGKIKLDDNINDYIENPIKNSTKISFKQLANHTSGLPKMPSNLKYSDKKNKFKEYNTLKLEEYLQNNLKLSFDAGKQSNYSNIGVGVLGYTLTKVSNFNYSNLLDNYIFSKYNMQKTTVKRKNISNYLIKGLDVNGNETPNWDLASLTPAGGILSSTEDLSNFAIAQFNPTNKELKLTQQKTFQIDKNTYRGLGWKIHNYSDNKWLSHNGKTGGYTSSILLDIENKNGVIILTNISTIGNKNKKYIVNLASDLLKTL